MSNSSLPRSALRTFAWLAAALVALSVSTADQQSNKLAPGDTAVEHGGGLNKCGCHFNRKTGACHCHQRKGCGCACQPATCE